MSVDARLRRMSRRWNIRPRTAAEARETVDDIILRRIELRLTEILDQRIVAAVAINDQDLLAPVPRHLRDRFLQHLQLQVRAISDSPRLMPRLEDLADEIFR